MLTDYISLLKKSLSFWEHLSDDEQEFLVENIRLNHYKSGSNIHRGDLSCLGLMLVKSGCIRSYMLSENGRDITLYRLTSGEVCILSASCILKDITFDIHIDVEEDGEILVLPSTVLSRLIEQNIYVENFAYKIAMQRFSNVMWTMEQILFMSFDKRLAIFLLDEIHKTKRMTLPLTHEQIAKYVGSAREVVSRMLKYFASEGILELQRGQIIIKDVERLEQLMEV